MKFCRLRVLLNFLSTQEVELISWHRISPNWANGLRDTGGQMCMTETWLVVCGWWGSWLHRMCLKNKGGHCLLPLVGAREGRLFLHEYQVEECDAEPLLAVIANSCKLYITPLPSLSFPPPFVYPSHTEGSEQSNRIGQSWHHRFCYVVRK